MIGASVGNFEIIAALGKGGMGEVWLAQQKSLKTKVAIKVLAAEISKNQTHVTRFRNEMVAVSQIPHSGIVKMFDSEYLPDGRAYIVMEYLEGETLSKRIKRMGRLSVSQIADFGRQISSVLDATHGAGITHRDLKPDNIYLVRDAELAHGERVKILDFGIARLDTTVGPRMTAVSVGSVGTPNYMSPEQWHSLAEADWHTDAYALGCVAFEMACGRPPFVADNRVEVCAMHLGEKPPVPSALVPGLPPAFDRLVSRLLEKEPRDRPTMRETIAVFTALGHVEGVELSTLPPKGVMSPFAANADSSMQYKMTPRAGMPSESGVFKDTPAVTEPPDAPVRASQIAGAVLNPAAFKETPIAGTAMHPFKATQIAGSAAFAEPIVGSQLPERDDATPVASMSLQFKPTPVSGFESQTGMRAQTDPATSQAALQRARQIDPGDSQRASQPMLGTSMTGDQVMAAARPRKRGLLIAIGVGVVAAAVVVAIVLAGGSSDTPGSTASGSVASGSAASKETGSAVIGDAPVKAGSGSAIDVGSGTAPEPVPSGPKIVDLPPLKHPGQSPKITAPLDLRVCIDPEGSVESVELKTPGELPKAIETVVASWEYQPYVDGKTPISVCGFVTISPPDSRKPVVVKGALPARLSPKMITDAIGRVQERVMDCDKGEFVANFDVALQIGKDGVVKSVDLTPKHPTMGPLIACLTKAFKAARFAATQSDHTVHQTLQFGR